MKFFNTSVMALCLTVTLFSCSKSGDNDPAPPVTPPVIPPVTTPVVPPTVYAGYTLLWNDEFNGASIDAANWNFETGTGVNGDFGTGQLDRATSLPSNASIENGVLNSGGGCLAITTRKEFFQDRNYTSARLTTQDKGSWEPGTRIEARVWARDVRYKGQGFAFWMMPAEKPSNQPYIMWPQGGEVDIMEYVGAIPKYNLGTVHYAWSWENNTYQNWNHGHKGGYYSYQEAQIPPVNPSYGGWPVAASEVNAGSGGFHTYRLDWYSNRMEFAVDDQVYHINYFNDGEAFSNAPDGEDTDGNVTIGGKRVMKSEYSHHFAEWSPFSHKFFLLLTAGVGGNDNMTYGGAIVNEAQFPCTTYVDWVRVYQRN